MIYNDVKYDISEKYSHKDMTGWDLSDRDDMDGIVVYNSCLSHETPDAPALPKNLKGATFIKCNMSNVFVPSGNTLIDCITTRFKCQNDGEDWVIHPVSKLPVEPVNKKRFEMLGLSIDPKDIPSEKMDTAITIEAEIGIKETI